MTAPMTGVGNPSSVARRPSSVLCRPAPSISTPMPSSSGQVVLMIVSGTMSSPGSCGFYRLDQLFVIGLWRIHALADRPGDDQVIGIGCEQRPPLFRAAVEPDATALRAQQRRLAQRGVVNLGQQRGRGQCDDRETVGGGAVVGLG